MTPSPTPQRKKKDDYDHPLRRSPRGEAGPAPRRGLRRPLPGAARGRTRGQARSHSLRPPNYETVTEAGRLADLARRCALSGPFRLQGEAHLVGPDAGRDGRRGARARAGTCGLCAARPSRLRRARSFRRDRGADPHAPGFGPAQASLGGPECPQDRAERQVRHGGACPLRHRASDHRRSLPHLLRARRRPRRASAGAARRQSARL